MIRTEKEKYRTVNLGEILKPDQLRKLSRIYQDCNGDMNQMIEKCQEWFREPAMARHLLSKDFVPAYAGYAIPFYYVQAKRKQLKAVKTQTK